MTALHKDPNFNWSEQWLDIIRSRKPNPFLSMLKEKENMEKEKLKEQLANLSKLFEGLEFTCKNHLHQIEKQMGYMNKEVERFDNELNRILDLVSKEYGRKEDENK